MKKLSLVLLCVSLLGALALASRQVGTPTALSLGGRVVDADTQRPVPGAAVTIRGGAPLPDPPTLVTDGDGRFRFDQLRPGRYTLAATALGYLTGGGDHSENGMPQPEVSVLLEAGLSRIDVRIGLVRPAAIHGVVVDSDNAPVESAQMAALREVYIAGVRRFQVGSAASADDAGQFRFSSLAPGRYIVCVVGERVTIPGAWQTRFEAVAAGTSQEQMAFTMQARQSGALMGLSNRGFAVGDFWVKPGNISVGPLVTSDGEVWSAPDVCNGGARNPLRAPLIVLAAGEQRLGETLVVDLDPAPPVSGRVTGPTGPVPWQTVTLESEGFDAFGWTEGVPYAMTTADAAGRFTLLGVAPGNYILNTYHIAIPLPGAAPGTLPTGESLSSRMPITVGRDGLTDLEVVMVAAAQPRGRVVFSGGGAAPTPEERSATAVRFASAEGIVTRAAYLQPTVVVQPDGTFQTAGLLRGHYVVQVPPAGRWRLDTAELNGVDVSDVPFVVGEDAQPEMIVTLTDQRWQVTGTVRNDQAVPVTAGHVVMFPTDRGRWVGHGAQPRRQRMVEVRDGSYVVEGLPAGEYFVVALPAGAAGEWQTPERFARWAGSAPRLTLGAHESRTIDLTVGGVR